MCDTMAVSISYGSAAHLSVMATCSNMADPVLLFQLPEMDVRLEKNRKL